MILHTLVVATLFHASRWASIVPKPEATAMQVNTQHGVKTANAMTIKPSSRAYVDVCIRVQDRIATTMTHSAYNTTVTMSVAIPKGSGRNESVLVDIVATSAYYQQTPPNMNRLMLLGSIVADD